MYIYGDIIAIIKANCNCKLNTLRLIGSEESSGLQNSVDYRLCQHFHVECTGIADTDLWRYAGSPKADSGLSKFSDVSSVASYAADAMAWAVENGIVAGANGALMPQDSATRAQVATILQQFIKVTS